MKRFMNWLTRKAAPKKALSGPRLSQTGAHLHQTGSHSKLGPTTTPKQAVPRRQPEYVKLDTRLKGRIEENGPGKNVLIRTKYVREDTGTHETLTILDDSLLDSEEEEGIDPYNTGRFDRSRNWDKRRK